MLRFLGHTQLDTYHVGQIQTSDQLVAEVDTHTKKHKRQTSKSSVGFESAIPGITRLYTYVLDNTAIGTVTKMVLWL